MLCPNSQLSHEDIITNNTLAKAIHKSNDSPLTFYSGEKKGLASQLISHLRTLALFHCGDFHQKPLKEQGKQVKEHTC